MPSPITFRRAAALVLAIAGLVVAPAAAAAQGTGPGQGPGGPVLVITPPGGGFGSYYAEILRAEGLNAFAVADTAALNPGTLASYQVVVLAQTPVNPGQADALSSWVAGGGNLIAMRPDPALAGLLGLGSDGGDLADAYLRVNTGAPPGAGITSTTMQFHGTADRWSLNGATPVATLYSDAGTSTNQPAVTLRSVGSAGGQAAAFTYDLARSVVYTRQGNPAWAGQERDFALDSLHRSDDLFYGNAPGDSQPDWVDLNKVAIPQADEQQRLLANLVTQMNLDRTPLPRFWYLPRGEKAAIVMTGDDHGSNGGTNAHFDTFKQLSRNGCSVADWACVRGTSYAYASTTVPGAQGYQNEGFEIAAHPDVNCPNNATVAQLTDDFPSDLNDFRQAFTGLNTPRTNRTHCIAWVGWADTARIEAANGIRLDTNYYYWPGSWVQNRPGMFTGSGFPMRFADVDGSIINVFQATTQMTDESEISYGVHARALIDGALGPEGYYGVFTANIHTDRSVQPAVDIIEQAQHPTDPSRDIPVISARQLLEWTEGRNASLFQSVGFAGNALSFRISRGDGAGGLEAMIPTNAATGAYTALTRDGQPVVPDRRVVKGMEYLVFPAAPGTYEATYGPGAPGPTTPGTGTGTGTGAAGGAGSGGAAAGGAGNASGSGSTGTGGINPRVARVRSRRVRALRTGTVRLRVRCPAGEVGCRVTLRLRRSGKQIARRRIVTIAPGETKTVAFRLTRSARARLARAGSLWVDVTATTRTGADSPATTRNRIRLLAPRR